LQTPELYEISARVFWDILRHTLKNFTHSSHSTV